MPVTSLPDGPALSCSPAANRCVSAPWSSSARLGAGRLRRSLESPVTPGLRAGAPIQARLPPRPDVTKVAREGYVHCLLVCPFCTLSIMGPRVMEQATVLGAVPVRVGELDDV